MKKPFIRVKIPLMRVKVSFWHVKMPFRHWIEDFSNVKIAFRCRFASDCEKATVVLY